MPRYARQHVPGALVHVITRFVNREFRLRGTDERAEFLKRLPAALARADWVVHAYALMSSHVHLAMTAGQAAPARFLKPLLVSVARHLNRAQARFGPVFGDRATTISMPQWRMGALVAYIHNNPARANLVSHPSETDWSSHRIWTGMDAKPPWLAADIGLVRAGWEPTAAGRRAFDDFVATRLKDARDSELSGTGLRRLRAAVRGSTALPVEISQPCARGADGANVDVLHIGAPPVAPRWNGDLNDLVIRAAGMYRVSAEELRSRTHRPAAVEARRLVMVTGAWLLRRPIHELAAALTISQPCASRLLRKGDRMLQDAQRIAGALREQGP